MAVKSAAPHKPSTPWETVMQRFITGPLDAAEFARKYNLDEAYIRNLIANKEAALSPKLCKALESETEMPAKVFEDISNQYLSDFSKRRVA